MAQDSEARDSSLVERESQIAWTQFFKLLKVEDIVQAGEKPSQNNAVNSSRLLGPN